MAGAASACATDQRSAVITAPKWYEGGTLHQKSALEWQAAAPADKLATCGDFISKMWQDGNLKREIQASIESVDDMKPYAEKLVAFLDAAMEKQASEDRNRELYTNQTIAGMAAIAMVSLGWAK